MRPEQVRIVQESFAQVLSAGDRAVAIFYARLFELDPRLRSLFKADIAAQSMSFKAGLAVLVESMKDCESVRATATALGRRHAKYGIADEDYVTMGEALIWTLEKVLGEAFTPQVRSAWLWAYAAISEIMIKASRGAADAA